jgi:DNA-directed RNA polymerase specialized sigma24 family protein
MPKTKVEGLLTRSQWDRARDAEVTKEDMEEVLSTIFNGTKPSPLERRMVTLKVLRCSNDLIADLLEKTTENVRKTLSVARQKGRNGIGSHCMTRA